MFYDDETSEGKVFRIVDEIGSGDDVERWTDRVRMIKKEIKEEPASTHAIQHPWSTHILPN